MGILCVTCEVVVSGGIEKFKEHITQRNHTAPYSCSEGDCSKRKFQVRSSLIRHLREHHSEVCHPESTSSASNDSDDDVSLEGSVASEDPVRTSPSEGDEVLSTQEDVEDGEDAVTGEGGAALDEQEIYTAGFEKSVERAAAFLILNLRKRGNVPGTAISIVIEETQKLIKDVITATKEQISANLKDSGVDEETINNSMAAVIIEEPFKHLKSKEQQLRYFEKNFNLVRPETKFIRHRYDQRLVPGSADYLPQQVSCTFQYISVIKTLTCVLNNPLLFDLIHREKPSTDDMLRSYLDGSEAIKNPLLVKYPRTLRLVLFADDFECASPIGSKTSIHKIVGVYYYIQNLPPEENARLRSIHVAAYGYREDLNEAEEGIDVLLQPFFDELEKLESEEGEKIMVNGEEYILRATLCNCTADALSEREMLGLSAPSSSKFCSRCLVTRRELHSNIFAMGEKRTHELHLRHLEQVRIGGEAVSKYLSVKRDCLLVRAPKYAVFPEAFMNDCMHYVLKGVAPMEIKLALREFCCIKKYFDVNFLNSRLESFNYGLPDSKNKPSPNLTDSFLKNLTKYNLSQTAAQTWCFLNVFPFLFGDRVPEDNPHMKLIVLLKRMCCILFSKVVSVSDLDLLENLIFDHHTLFFELFPPEIQDAGVEEINSDDSLESQEDSETEETQEQSHAPAAQDCSTPRQRKKKKVVRPINKHHDFLHAVELIRKYGPAVLYWCMRLEAKHQVAKKFASICCNFKNLPLTLADMHQMHHAAELTAMKGTVRDEHFFPPGVITTVDETGYTEALSTVNLQRYDVIIKVGSATVAGFDYRAGMCVTLPLSVNSLPLFGCIVGIYKKENNAYLVTEDIATKSYDTAFGAYQIERIKDGTIRAFKPSRLPPHRPMILWTPFESSRLYLSPRCALADTLLLDE